jgi:hypothetical protein
MSTKNSENTCVVQGKEYKAVPRKDYSAPCSGCAFNTALDLCNESGQCYEGGIGDNTEIKNIIWVLKGE